MKPLKLIFSTAILATAAIVQCPSANASVIAWDTRFYNGGSLSDADTYQSTIENLVGNSPTASYCHQDIAVYDGVSNHSVCSGGSTTNIAFRIEVGFGVTAAQAGAWNFRIGPDFGLGGAVFLDGVSVAFNPNDMWWNGSYANPSQIFQIGASLAEGNHVLSIYGLEGCCDGGQQGQFQIGSGNWVTFAATDGLNRIPEPATFALLGLGMAGLAFTRRRKAIC